MPIKNVQNKNNIAELENLKKFLQNNINMRDNKNTQNIEELNKKNDFNKKEMLEEKILFEEYNESEFEVPFEDEVDSIIEKLNKNKLEENNENEEKANEDENEVMASEVYLNLSNINREHVKENISIKDMFIKNKKNINSPNSNLNPLLKYRDPGISIKLPSLGYYYDDSVIEFEENNEINIFPMTMRDEIYIRSPDYLLNGSAIEYIIYSCVPSVKNVKKLLINDISAIMLGIKCASDSKIVSYSANCPKCNTKNNFSIDIFSLFDNMNYLKEEYVVEIDNLQVYLKPYTYDLMVKNTITSFEESKIVQTIISSTDMSEQEKTELAKKSLERLQELVFYSLLKSIQKIIIKNTKEIVTNEEFIKEWLSSLKIKHFNKLKDTLLSINEIGVPTSINVVCNNCKNKFDVDVRFDPSNFLD